VEELEGIIRMVQKGVVRMVNGQRRNGDENN